MNAERDPIMDEVSAVRRELSAECGHDAFSYFASVKDEKREAAKRGMSYFDYCLALVDGAGKSLQFA